MTNFGDFGPILMKLGREVWFILTNSILLSNTWIQEKYCQYGILSWTPILSIFLVVSHDSIYKRDFKRVGRQLVRNAFARRQAATWPGGEHVYIQTVSYDSIRGACFIDIFLRMDDGEISNKPERFFYRMLVNLAAKHKQHEAQDKLVQMLFDENNPEAAKKPPRNNKG